jgi:hypothetical protein
MIPALAILRRKVANVNQVESTVPPGFHGGVKFE